MRNVSLNVMSALKNHVFHDCGMHGVVLARIRKKKDDGGIGARYCCGWFETNHHVPTLYEFLDREFILVPKGGKGRENND